MELLFHFQIIYAKSVCRQGSKSTASLPHPVEQESYVQARSSCAGKLDCYVAAAGFSPTRVLPVVVDVGTDNEALRNDPLYTGLRQKRICGQEYFEVGLPARMAVQDQPTLLTDTRQFSLLCVHYTQDISPKCKNELRLKHS